MIKILLLINGLISCIFVPLIIYHLLSGFYDKDDIFEDVAQWILSMVCASSGYFLMLVCGLKIV